MRPISTRGLQAPGFHYAGTVPTLRWLPIADLVIDPSYRPPLGGKGRRNITRIARSFSWSFFAPVIVAPAEAGKFTIIDGQDRTTAAALVGIDSVPCEVVSASPDQQAAAFKAINGAKAPVSRMSVHAAAVAVSEDRAVKLVEICRRADVELLRYPVAVDRQSVGQTMAIGALAQCFKRYGEATLITALQCVTQTNNNQPGILSARMIKALCIVLHSDQAWRDGGLALLEAFDAIDLTELQRQAASGMTEAKSTPVETLANLIAYELGRTFCLEEGQEISPAPPRERQSPRRDLENRPKAADRLGRRVPLLKAAVGDD